jgi:hypothetical protein
VDSLKISTGEKRIAINDDPARVIVFNPDDVLFAEKFYNLYAELNTAQKDYQERAKQIDANKALDAAGVPVNVAERLAYLKDINHLLRGKIDDLFGAGTSQKAFGDALSFDMDVYKQFFSGITPFVKSARSAKVEQYSSKPPKRVRK